VADYEKATRASKTSVLLALARGDRHVLVDAIGLYRAQGWDLSNPETLRRAANAEIDRRIPIPEGP
jgi:hypothetical protein